MAPSFVSGWQFWVEAAVSSLRVLWSIRVSRSPEEVAARAQFYDEIADVDPRWVLP